MSNRWPQSTLGDVAIPRPGNGKIIKGTLPTRNDGKLFPAYSATGQDVFSEEYDHDGDGIVVSAVGARCGKCFLATGRWMAIANTHVLLPRKDKVVNRFLWYLVNDENFWVRGGTAQPFVKMTDSLRNQIPLPPLPEQERIVRILDEAESLRRLRDHADERTDALVPSLFRDMFGSPAVNPFGWPMTSVGGLFDERRDGAKCGPFGSALKKHEYTDHGVPVWGIPNVVPNEFVETGSLFISPSKFEDLRAYSVESGDLLISRAGTVGRICVARPRTKESIIGTNLIRVALDRKKVVPEFFSALMTHFASEVGHLRADTDESAYSFMSTTVLKTLQIYLPPLKFQETFAARIAEIRDMEASQTASRQRLDNLFQALLHRAFQGEL